LNIFVFFFFEQFFLDDLFLSYFRVHENVKERVLEKKAITEPVDQDYHPEKELCMVILIFILIFDSFLS